MTVKRIRKYVLVDGVELNEENAPVHTQHIVDGNFTDEERVKNRAMKEFSGFLPTKFEFHRQTVSMSDEDFYAHGTFGDDEIVDPKTGEALVQTSSDNETVVNN